MSGEEAAAVALLGMGVTTMLMVLVFWILLVIARWKMFTKAGEAGWKAIIPIYADYIGFKLWWDTKNFWIYLVTALVYGVAYSFLLNANGTMNASGNPVAAVVLFVAAIVLAVWYIRYTLKTVKAYGKGTGMGILMIFFPNIITLILGFGSAQYIGPQK